MSFLLSLHVTWNWAVFLLRALQTAVNEAQVVRRWGSGGIHSSVVFHLAGNKGYLTVAEGLWRLEELATDQKFICPSPGLAPKVCQDKKLCGPWPHTTERPFIRLLKPQSFKVLCLFFCWHLKCLALSVITCQSAAVWRCLCLWYLLLMDSGILKVVFFFCVQPWWLLPETV